MKTLSECLLYTFVDMAYLRGRKPAEITRQLCDGGSDLIQLRAKASTADEIRRLAETILPITRAAKVGLVINDHFQVACNIGAEFCHLGQEDFFGAGCHQVSELLCHHESGRPGIGLSSHAPAQGERAVAAGASYIAVGPVFPTATKPNARPVTLEYVRWAAEHVPIPWFAIGGVNLENIDSVLAAGARRICVVSAILNSADLAGTCQKFKQRLFCGGSCIQASLS